MKEKFYSCPNCLMRDIAVNWLHESIVGHDEFRFNERFQRDPIQVLNESGKEQFVCCPICQKLLPVADVYELEQTLIAPIKQELTDNLLKAKQLGNAMGFQMANGHTGKVVFNDLNHHWEIHIDGKVVFNRLSAEEVVEYYLFFGIVVQSEVVYQ